MKEWGGYLAYLLGGCLITFLLMATVQLPSQAVAETAPQSAVELQVPFEVWVDYHLALIEYKTKGLGIHFQGWGYYSQLGKTEFQPFMGDWLYVGPKNIIKSESRRMFVMACSKPFSDCQLETISFPAIEIGPETWARPRWYFDASGLPFLRAG